MLREKENGYNNNINYYRKLFFMGVIATAIVASTVVTTVVVMEEFFNDNTSSSSSSSSNSGMTGSSSTTSTYSYPTTPTTPSSENTQQQQQQPTVYFPTPEAVRAYNTELGSKISTLASTTGGQVNEEIKIATKGDETFVAWIAKDGTTGINHVFYSVTRDRGNTFTTPIELSPPSASASSSSSSTTPVAATSLSSIIQTAEAAPPSGIIGAGGNASNLQLAVYDNSYVDVVWQSFDPTANKYNIMGSVSMDNGVTFKTYQLNYEGTNAVNPVLTGNFMVIWKEGVGCTPEIQSVSTSATTTATQQGDCIPVLRFRW